ncbi:Eukaryotic translation initiation factor eIF2A [Giardia duodenalis]|uniref:Eukaryotic translation initiation factor eIF2A n=1 Tax=Giardia intestinalis (strain ATCC 50803 / WB clone C6) TaxID=184922 RepID=D3KHR5_GIAIC|nr:Eukaryotic translation initiation factor eIF2A [Giardia intestinalis]KAE8304100.1 Eukaryotic translation initiation factor eIF2A [Giardia intestinalis]
MQPIITNSADGAQVWSFDGKRLVLTQTLSQQQVKCSAAITRSDNLMLVFLTGQQEITCRVYESTLKRDILLKEVTHTMPHPIESFTLSHYGTLIQLHCNVQRPLDNFLLVDALSGTIVASMHSTIRLAGFRSMSWPYCLSEDEDYVLFQDGWLLCLKQYDLASRSLKDYGYVSAIPRDQPWRLTAYHFTLSLKVPSDSLDKYSVIVCIPSQGGSSGYAIVYKLSQFVELSSAEVETGRTTSTKPMEIADKIMAKPYMYCMTATCDVFVFKPSESGAWFLLLEKTDVDTSKANNYYGGTILRHYCIINKAITLITDGKSYVHDFSIRPLAPADRSALASGKIDSLKVLTEMFVVIYGVVPPKVCSYVVMLTNLDRKNASAELQKDINFGNMPTNSTSWDVAGRYLLLRGEAGMNGDSRILRPIINNEPKYLAKGTIHSRTHALFSPRGDVLLYLVTKPRFTVDNGIEIFDMNLKSLAAQPFEALSSAYFIPYCKADYAAVGLAEEVEGVYLSAIKTETKKYVPPSQRKK